MSRQSSRHHGEKKEKKKKSKKSKREKGEEEATVKTSSQLEIKLKRLDVHRCGKNILARMATDKNVKELINLIQSERKLALE
jgi:hypothetical protein